MKEQKRINTMSNIKVFRFTGFAAIMMIVFVITSCRPKSNSQVLTDELTTIKVNPLKTNTLEEFISKVESVRFLPLESNADNPIDWVRKVWVTDKSILLYTGHTKEVHKYGHDGSFKFKIEKKGKGKSELSWVNDFCPAPNDGLYVLGYNEYYLFDSIGLMQSNHIIEPPFESFVPRKFFIVNDTFQIFSTSSSGNKNTEVENNSIRVFNKATSENQFSLYRYSKGIGTEVFNQSNDCILINPNLGLDTIYTWKKNRVIPLFAIDFGKYKTPVNELPKEYNNGRVIIDFLYKNPGCLYIKSAFMSDNWLTFIFTFNNNEYKVLYHKKKKDILIGNRSLDLFEHILFGPVPLAVFHDEFISAVPAYEIVKKLESNSLDFKFLSEARHQEIIAQLKKVKETDNPVLMFVKMKPE